MLTFSLCTTGSYIIQEMAMQRDHWRPIIRRYKKTVFTNFSNNVTESLSSCWRACKPILRTASTTESNIDTSALRATFWTTLVCLKLVKSLGALLVTFSYTSKSSVAIFAYSSKAIVRRKINQKTRIALHHCEASQKAVPVCCFFSFLKWPLNKYMSQLRKALAELKW